MSGEFVTVKRTDLQRLFDLAVNSLDFGSGFWESDDVPAARRIAEALGVDPTVATPSNFRDQYPHPFEPMVEGTWRFLRVQGYPELPEDACYVCKRVDNPLHASGQDAHRGGGGSGTGGRSEPR